MEILTTNSTNFGGELAAYKYNIMPEDVATGVFCHEFGHDLGLPDEYDTNYSGVGEPVSYWSIMSSGSWAGKIPGTEPTGFSPYGKLYFQSTYGGNWMHGSEINIMDIPTTGLKYVLDQAAIKGNNNGFVKVNLPEKTTNINTPASGTKEYFSGKGDDMNNSMLLDLDLLGKTTAKLTFNTWYDIEKDYDYAYIKVKAAGATNWVTVPGNLTTTMNPEGANLGNGITGNSNGWVSGEFDLSQFAGQKLQLKFSYITDAGLSMPGIYVDDMVVQADGATIFSDDVEATPKFTMDKFTVSDGNMYTPQYYLLEWRNQVGADLGLAHIKRGNSLMSYDTGLLVWYVDESFTDNWTGVHPGKGFIGVVDADQSINRWNYADTVKPLVASTKYQIHDAAFSLKQTQKMFLNYGTQTLTDKTIKINNTFNDGSSYISALIPDAGRLVPKYGLNISVIGEANGRSSATIMLKVK